VSFKIVMAEEILQGLRVLDLTRVLAGPYATRILADFGAEVIKVQSKKTATGAESNTTPYFQTWNRNKKSIALDLNHSEARELFLTLVEISDVVVENFSPRVMANWGFSYGQMKEVNSQLIMLSMSGFGQNGPWKNYVAYGPTLQSLGGLSYLTAYSNDEPLGLGSAYADIISGTYGALAILAALEFRDKTEMGQHIDLSEYEAVCTTIGPTLMDAFTNQHEIGLRWNGEGYIPAVPYGCYKCAGEDRWCAIAVTNENQWKMLCKILGNPPWSQASQFSTLPMRVKYKNDLDGYIGKWTISKSAENIVQDLQEVGVPSGVVQNAADLSKDIQLLSRKFFASTSHPAMGEITADTIPINFKNTPRDPLKAAPLLGEDNRYVYEELLGLSEEKIQTYIKGGIIA
jgi:crotonobetainyl-CoA:carnitine CoA-transferase CaiB-like acyl-CoA transferase